MINYNKGAMFGLDARIALAIFGTLSVIGGAALYNAIQNSKATAAISSMSEVGKAWEQHYLDTGKEILEVHSNGLLKINELVTNIGQDGWKGPYIPYELINDRELQANNNMSFQIAILTGDNTWITSELPENASTQAECVAGVKCAIWVKLGPVNSSVAKVMDQQYDGATDFLKGKLRAYQTNSSSPYYVYLKVAPINNPNG